MRRFCFFIFGILMLSIGSNAWAAPVEEFRMPVEGRTDCAFVQEVLQKRLGYGHIGAYAFQAFMLYTGFCETPDVARAEAQFEKVLPTGAPVAQLWLARKRHLAGDAEGAEKALVVAAYRWAKEELESYRLVADRLLPRSLQPTANVIGERILGAKKAMAPIEKLRLGKALKSGEAEIQDDFAACSWLEVAIRANLQEARFLLAKWQLYGDGIRQNVIASTRALSSLAKAGHVPSQILLGKEALRGTLVSYDARTAYYLFLLVREAGVNASPWLEKAEIAAEDYFENTAAKLRDMVDQGEERSIVFLPADGAFESDLTVDLDRCFSASM